MVSKIENLPKQGDAEQVRMQAKNEVNFTAGTNLIDTCYKLDLTALCDNRTKWLIALGNELEGFCCNRSSFVTVKM